MSEFERKVAVSHKTFSMLENEAREDIAKLCGELAGKVGDYKKCPSVLKSLEALNHAMDIYIDVLNKAKDEYYDAVGELADAQFNAKYV